MATSSFPSVPVVDGACPFVKESHPPECAATPATHFALAAGPASDTAVLLPFAQHRWHSRLVAALRDDARATHGGDLSTAATFVLVALPEQARPKVFDLLVKVLELRRDDRHSETGLPDDIPDRFRNLVTGVFSIHVHSSTSLDDPMTIAALCQLCRLSEFIQLSIGVDLACSFIAPWVEHVHTTGLARFVFMALESACRDELKGRERSPHGLVARGLTPDAELLEKLHTQNCSRCLGRTSSGTIPQVLFDVLPPGVIPGPVLDSRLQCYMSTAAAWLPVNCGQAPDSTRCQLYVTAASDPRLQRNQFCHATFGNGPKAVADFKALCSSDRRGGCPFLSLRLPGAMAAADFAGLTILDRTQHLIAPPDMNDIMFEAFRPHLLFATVIDLSQSKIVTIPELCFSMCTALLTVNLPPTVATIGDFAFPETVARVTGVCDGVDTLTFPWGCAVTS